MPILPDPLLHADMQVSAEVETPSAPFEKRVLVRLHGLVHAKPQLGVPQRLLAHLLGVEALCELAQRFAPLHRRFACLTCLHP